MSISARKKWRTRTLLQLALAVFTAVFGFIYERFGHGVHSPYMQYAFLIPLILGVLPFGLWWIFGKIRITNDAVSLWSWGIVTLTVGSVFQGVLEIYGTTNRLIWVYLFAGVILLAAAAVKELWDTRRTEN